MKDKETILLLAYGSNLNLPQMEFRSFTAKVVYLALEQQPGEQGNLFGPEWW